MDPESTLAFAEKAENKLREIRSGILACRQGDSITELETQLRGIRILTESAASLGLTAMETVLETFDQESNRIFKTGGPLSDAGSRDLLDLLANAEAEVLKSGLEVEDNPINVGDFIDQSFDILQLDAFQASLPVDSVSDTEEAADEFEIDAEMLEIFAMEAEDLLGSIETNLDMLVATPGNRDALWEIRRNAHTFKGAAGIVGLKKPSQLAHRVEDLLDNLAQNEIGPDEKILDLLTTSTTCLRLMTGGDTSPSMTARMNEVYRVFDDVMGSLTNPKSVTAISNLHKAAAPIADAAPAEDQSVQARPIVRVSIARLDELVRIVRDLVVNGSVIEQRMLELERQIEELHGTTRRLQAASERIETDFEASMLGTQPEFSFGGTYQTTGRESVAVGGQFDSLELDRYTDFHESTRELTEATSDSFSINTALEALKGSLEMVFDDQRRLIEEMQAKVMLIRLIQFSSLTTRLQRAVRVTCEEEYKLAEVTVENPETELDTDVLDSLVEPLMHLLRNAVVHGIESPDTRRLLGKPEKGNIVVRVTNEETHIVLRVSDDGRGIAGSILKEKAVSAGLIDAKAAELLDADEMLDLIFLPGLTTAERLSMSAGRGVGMSIVKESIEAKNGTITVETAAQRGTAFTVRIPLAYAVARVLLVRSDRQTLAIPLKLVKHISEFSPADVKRSGGDQVLEFESGKFPVRYLADHISVQGHDYTNDFTSTLLIETGDSRYALMVDDILKTEEIAIKMLGKPLENLKGTLGAAILGSGDVVPILDLPFLLENKPRRNAKQETRAPVESKARCVMVVDDSPSVRHMTSKVIVGAGWDVTTAKDGVEALEILQACAEPPDVILTDVEMPRMDGYELISSLKANPLLREIPVVLITSRSGEKHRDKALDLGVSDYLAKPYDDSELISAVERLSKKA